MARTKKNSYTCGGTARNKQEKIVHQPKILKRQLNNY